MTSLHWNLVNYLSDRRSAHESELDALKIIDRAGAQLHEATRASKRRP